MTLSDYNHLRCMLGLKPVSLSANEFFIHCDTWNYVREKIQKALEQKSKITLAGNVLEIAETAIHTEPMEQYQMAGTRGYALVVPDKVANQLSGEKIGFCAYEIGKWRISGVKTRIEEVLHDPNAWMPELQDGKKFTRTGNHGRNCQGVGALENSLTGLRQFLFAAYI